MHQAKAAWLECAHRSPQDSWPNRSCHPLFSSGEPLKPLESSASCFSISLFWLAPKDTRAGGRLFLPTDRAEDPLSHQAGFAWQLFQEHPRYPAPRSSA